MVESFFVPTVFLFTFTIFLPSFHLPCVFGLFHSCFSLVQVFARTLVHEFLIYYEHTEWYRKTSHSTSFLSTKFDVVQFMIHTISKNHITEFFFKIICIDTTLYTSGTCYVRRQVAAPHSLLHQIYSLALAFTASTCVCV